MLNSVASEQVRNSYELGSPENLGIPACSLDPGGTHT